MSGNNSLVVVLNIVAEDDCKDLHSSSDVSSEFKAIEATRCTPFLRLGRYGDIQLDIRNHEDLSKALDSIRGSVNKHVALIIYLIGKGETKYLRGQKLPFFSFSKKFHGQPNQYFLHDLIKNICCIDTKQTVLIADLEASGDLFDSAHYIEEAINTRNSQNFACLAIKQLESSTSKKKLDGGNGLGQVIFHALRRNPFIHIYELHREVLKLSKSKDLDFVPVVYPDLTDSSITMGFKHVSLSNPDLEMDDNELRLIDKLGLSVPVVLVNSMSLGSRAGTHYYERPVLEINIDTSGIISNLIVAFAVIVAGFGGVQFFRPIELEPEEALDGQPESEPAEIYTDNAYPSKAQVTYSPYPRQSVINESAFNFPVVGVSPELALPRSKVDDSKESRVNIGVSPILSLPRIDESREQESNIPLAPRDLSVESPEGVENRPNTYIATGEMEQRIGSETPIIGVSPILRRVNIQTEDSQIWPIIRQGRDRLGGAGHGSNGSGTGGSSSGTGGSSSGTGGSSSGTE
jgi:hypothetical protein